MSDARGCSSLGGTAVFGKVDASMLLGPKGHGRIWNLPSMFLHWVIVGFLKRFLGFEVLLHSLQKLGVVAV